ncbi:extracellular solute-binding protein, partial [Paenibacillus sp. MCAF20]
GHTYSDLEQASTSCKEAVRALRSARLLQTKGIVRFEELGEAMTTPKGLSEREEAIVLSIRAGNKAGLLEQIDYFIAWIQNEKVDPEIIEREMLKLIYMTLQAAHESGLDAKADEFQRRYMPHVEIREMAVSGQLLPWFREQIEKIADLTMESREQTKHAAVEQARAYIELNISRDLSLQEVAGHVGLNATYLSVLFKEVMGETYIKFLTRYRMEYAKILLALMTSMLAACGSNSNGTNDNQAPAANDNATSAPATNDNGASDKKVTISLLTDNTQDAVNTAKAVIEAFEAKFPNITVEHETRPSGGEGDNFVKTRLSTGDMNDVFFYNSGSLMQALNPEQNMVDLTNEPYMANVLDTFKTTVAFDGKVYGAPAGAAMGGGWFYNKKVYADLGLTVPKTWDELMANNEKIKAAGITPVIGTYKDDWTSQLILLADYYNVQAQAPAFAEEYTANKAKFATTPAALRGFEKLQEVFDKGFLNKDFKATTY